VSASGEKWKIVGNNDMSFRGITAINIDVKGRMALPARYREALGEELVVTIDTEDRCLLLYPLAQWEKIEEQLQQLPTFNKATRRIQRLLIGHATELEVDAQGRILLPSLLREYAGVEKKLVLVGQGRRFELWDEERWDANRDGWLIREDMGEVGVPPELEAISL